MTAFQQLPLRTERLLLRPLRESDAAALYEIHADPTVMRYWSSPVWTSIDQAHAAIARNVAGLASGEHLRLGLERLEDCTIIGHCSLFNLSSECRRAEIGYALAASAWRQGYMNEALDALVRYGFAQLDLNRIEADVDPRNTASAAVLERLGFVREGLLRERWVVSGEVSDSALYGLLRKDWRG